mgnify:CR=1 FL=1
MNSEFSLELLPVIHLPDHPEWVALNQLAWKTAFGNVSKNPYPTWETQVACMPGVPIIWTWDSCFIALYSRYSNGHLPALGNLNSLYAHQREDGYISMAYDMTKNEPAYGERVNPPLFAWAELATARQTGDLDRCRRVLPHLIALFNWYKANRRRPDGLYWFEDAGSSGMDNSPRSGYESQYLNGSDICHVDLISQQAHVAEVISEIATLLGLPEIATRFTGERQAILSLIGKHWCERTGFYYDLFYRTDTFAQSHGGHNFVNHRTIASFWPMFAGACSREQAACLVQALMDPDDFWTPHPVASLSRKDPNYNPKGGYWLGGVWAPTNYMVVHALRRYGYFAEAKELVRRHLNAMHRVASDRQFGGIWETYSPELDRPSTKVGEKLVRPNFVGWSGLGPISMLIEDILGFEFNALAKEIRWRIAEPGEHGISNLAYDGGTVSLFFSPATKTITIKTDRSFKLTVESDGADREFSVTAGEHSLSLKD